MKQRQNLQDVLKKTGLCSATQINTTSQPPRHTNKTQAITKTKAQLVIEEQDT